MTDQLVIWEGAFGDAYTERNVIAWQTLRPLFQTMLEGLALNRILEVGCNRGLNLRALSALYPAAQLMGLEANDYALHLAQQTFMPGGALGRGNLFNLPFADHSVDLVFTAGVLIHIALDDLPQALAELYRVSRRYLLAIEYYAATETVIPYRGYTNLPWKRDFLKHYQTRFPDLIVRRSGFWEVWDHSHWWLLEKV